MQNCMLSCSSVRVWNVVSHTKVRTENEGVWEQGTEENICTWKVLMTGGWGNVHNEKLHNLSYNLPNIVRRIRLNTWMIWKGHIASMGEIRKPEGTRTFGRPRHRREDNINMNLKVLGWKRVDYIHLNRDRVQWWALVSAVMKSRVP
jgi:hypothetical protein